MADPYYVRRILLWKMNTLRSVSKNPVGKTVNNLKLLEEISRLRWVIPSHRVGILEKVHVRRANRYLLFQGVIISNLINKGEYRKATTRFIWLLRTSKSYWVYAFNKWNRGWYFNTAYSEMKKDFRSFVTACRSLPAYVSLKRVYVPKKNGKMRPLGIPKLNHRLLNSCWAEFIYICLEDKIMDDQHGFRKGRGIYTAWKQIIDRTKNGQRIWEFDLKSFFNTINPLSINQILSKIDPRISTWVQRVNLNAIPKFKDNQLYYEEEFKKYLHDGIYILEKTGVPQGLPWSPLLASMVLSHTGFKDEDCIMYADDGIIFLRDDEEEKDLVNRIQNSKGFKQSGIKFSVDKSGMVGETLKFCGAELNLDTRVLTVDGKEYAVDSLGDDQLKKILGKVNYGNKKTQPDWKWIVHNQSWLSLRSLEIWPSVLMYMKTLLSQMRTWLGLKPLKSCYGYRTHGLKLYNYLAASTEACEDLLIGRKIRMLSKSMNSSTKFKIKKVPKANMLAAPLSEKHTYKNPKKFIKIDNTQLYLVNAPSYHYKGWTVS